jgi:hypothetical protein
MVGFSLMLDAIIPRDDARTAKAVQPAEPVFEKIVVARRATFESVSVLVPEV